MGTAIRLLLGFLKARRLELAILAAIVVADHLGVLPNLVGDAAWSGASVGETASVVLYLSLITAATVAWALIDLVRRGWVGERKR